MLRVVFTDKNFVKNFNNLKSNKTPKIVPLREPPGSFCDIGCGYCFASLELIHLLLFLLPLMIKFSSKCFLPIDVCYCTLLFVTQMREGTSHPGSFFMLAVIELPLSARAWSWATDVLFTSPSFHYVASETKSIK